MKWHQLMLFCSPIINTPSCTALSKMTKVESHEAVGPTRRLACLFAPDYGKSLLAVFVACEKRDCWVWMSLSILSPE